MSTQHTPGPWSYRGSLGPHSNPHLLGPHVVENATGIQIAILNGWRSEVSEVNARLIAAAPALLEALIVMVDNFGPTPSDDVRGLGEARAAIAVAMGQS
jgi:hypothetical protein